MSGAFETEVEGVKIMIVPASKNNAVLIQQVYPGLGYEEMLEMQVERNQKYCDKWQMDYQHVIGNPRPEMDPQKGSWAKIELIKQALEQGYEYVIWLDADTIVADFSVDLRDACSYGHIGACWQRIPQLHHWNVGALYIHDLSHLLPEKHYSAIWAFLKDWLSSYPGDADGWNEQGVFNRLAMSSKIVQTISDRWNATFNYTECPDAVVLGYHGAGDTAQRITLMKSVLKELEK